MIPGRYFERNYFTYLHSKEPDHQQTAVQVSPSLCLNFCIPVSFAKMTINMELGKKTKQNCYITIEIRSIFCRFPLFLLDQYFKEHFHFSREK